MGKNEIGDPNCLSDAVRPACELIVMFLMNQAPIGGDGGGGVKINQDKTGQGGTIKSGADG